MNSPSTVAESSKDLLAAAAVVTDQVLNEAWFEAPSSRRTPSTIPPVRVGEFLGDPLADAWLR